MSQTEVGGGGGCTTVKLFVCHRLRGGGGGCGLYNCKAVFLCHRVRCVVGRGGGGGCTTVKLCLCITE